MNAAATVEPKQVHHSEEWSDDLCKEISSIDYFTSDVLDLEVQKNVITRFYNFYLGGKVPKGFTVTDLVFSVISIMPLHVATEIPPWSEKEYGEDGTLFFLPPEDKRLAQKNAASRLSTYQNHVCFLHYINDDEVVTKQDSVDNESLPQNYNLFENINITAENKGNRFTADVDGESSSNNVRSEQRDKNIDYKERPYNCANVNIETNEVIGHAEQENERQDTNSNSGTHNGNENLQSNSSKVFHSNENLDNIKRKYKRGKTNKLEEKNNSELKEEQNYDTEKQNLEAHQTSKPNENDDTFRIRTYNKWLGLKRKPEIDTNPPQYGPVENNAFITFCQQLLDRWNKDPTARMVLKYFFGVAALILMRGANKSYKHIINTFSSTKFVVDHINYIHKYSSMDFKYCTPNKECVSVCYKTFRKREIKTRVMLAKLITCSGYIDTQLPLRPVQGVDLTLD